MFECIEKRLKKVAKNDEENGVKFSWCMYNCKNRQQSQWGSHGASLQSIALHIEVLALYS